MKYSEKTIPYRLSPAELENLRILRNRTQSSGPIRNPEAQKRSWEETDVHNSDPGPLEKKPETKPS